MEGMWKNAQKQGRNEENMNGYKLAEEDVLYEDKFIIVCRKRAGIATQTARLGEADLESALKNYLETPYVAVIHRLDQPVEGILAFAKTKDAAAGLSRQSAGQVMNKKYYAVAMMGGFRGGTFTEDASGMEDCAATDFFVGAGKKSTLVDYLQRNGRENTSRVVSKDAKDGKRAELTYEVLADKDGLPVQAESGEREENTGAVQAGRAVWKRIALLRIQLKTGRHHQIRVQMAHAGMPLLGDSKYGSEESKDYSRRMGIKNIALCAYSLDFLHPVTGKKMNFEITPKGNGFCPFFPVNS